MSNMEDILATTKLNEMITKQNDEEKCRKKVITVLAVIGLIAAVAVIAYAVYRFVSNKDADELDDFDDDFDDDFFNDDDEEDEEQAPESSEAGPEEA